MQASKIKKIREKVRYCYVTNALVMRTGADTTRVLEADEDGFLIFTIDKVRYKGKIQNMIWFVTKGEIPSNQVVFHKDLNTSNNKIQNLTLVKKSDILKIKEAIRNLQSALKVQKSTKDAFSYFIEYREDQVTKRETFHDVDVAKAKLLVLQLKFSKVLDPYVCTN